MNSLLVLFYQGSAPDSEGRMIGDIHRWANAQLENRHDYIQWLFPLKEASAFNPNAPVITTEDIRTFDGDPVIQRNIDQSLAVFLSFLGLEVQRSEKNFEVIPTDHWPERKLNWLSSSNHNLLRITRVLKFLTLVNRRREAQSLLNFLNGLPLADKRVIGSRTFSFWSGAVQPRT